MIFCLTIPSVICGQFIFVILILNFFFFAGIDNWIRSRKKIQDMDQKKPTIQGHANRTEEELRNQDAAAYDTTPPREEQTRLT